MTERDDRAGGGGWRISGRAHDLDVAVDTVEGVDGVAVVALRGDLDVYTHDRLRQLFRQGEGVGEPHVVLDLSEVGFLDSTGVGSIVVAHRAVAARDAALHLVAAERSVLRLLAVTGLDRSIPVHATREAAVAAAR